jgi:hypothetical protein
MDDEGQFEIAPFTAANLGAAETKVNQALAAQLATGLPTNPDSGQPDIRMAVRAAAQMAAGAPAEGAFILILPVGGATTVVPGATPSTPNSGWTT